MSDKKQPVKLVGDDLEAAGVDPSLIGAVEVELEAVIGSAKMNVADLMKLDNVFEGASGARLRCVDTDQALLLLA